MAVPQPTLAKSLSDAELLARYQERCRRLNEALEAERAKTSKLRRYISRLNVKPETALQAQQNLTGLQILVSDQNKLIGQLYNENQSLRKLAAVKETLNQQLNIANEKLKTRIIQLRRQVREFMANHNT